MTKSQSQQAFNTASGQQGTTSGNAQSSYQAATGDIGDYKTALAKYAGSNPYVTGGSYQTATNQGLSDTAAAGAQGAQQAITASMIRSGGNPAAGVAAGEQVAEANARNQMGAQADAAKTQAAGLAGYDANVLSASAKPEEMEQGLTSTELGGANSALGSETQASQTPSFWQEMGQAALSTGGAVAGAYCPAEGSRYLMADGTERVVELIKVGDMLRSIAGEPQVVEEIERARVRVIKVTTAGGLTLRCSRTHAFALPGGGFVSALKSLGKRIVTLGEDNLVVAVADDGEALVYNVISDGSHTYRANGMWSVGVAEAERQVSMDEWNAIAERMVV